MDISAQAQVQRCKNMVHVKIFYPLAPMLRTVFLPLPPLFLFFPPSYLQLIQFPCLDFTHLSPHDNFSEGAFWEITLKALKVKIRTVFRLNASESYVD